MFIVMTQTLENYGAHCEDGKFSSGDAYWKFKGGDTYLVEGLDRPQDATAFVAAMVMNNDIGYKEYPAETMTVAEWELTLRYDAGESQSCRDYYLSQVKRVSPITQGTKKGMTEMEVMLR